MKFLQLIGFIFLLSISIQLPSPVSTIDPNPNQFCEGTTQSCSPDYFVDNNFEKQEIWIRRCAGCDNSPNNCSFELPTNQQQQLGRERLECNWEIQFQSAVWPLCVQYQDLYFTENCNLVIEKKLQYFFVGIPSNARYGYCGNCSAAQDGNALCIFTKPFLSDYYNEKCVFRNILIDGKTFLKYVNVANKPSDDEKL